VTSRLAGIALMLLGGNIAAWAWAAALFRGDPVLLGMAALAYGLGLRHAVDPDHIAAIDNVTRKLMQEGQRPLTVGLFFALGHSTVVVIAVLLVALATTAIDLGRFKEIGAAVGTMVSAVFLLTIAMMNLAVLKNVVAAWRSGSIPDNPAFGGLVARLLRPLFRMIGGAWMMFPLGFLFGLGFDTATEVGLLSLSAKGAAQQLPLAALLVFPALFTAGMTLIDSADGILMVGAYGWAFVKPQRKLLYNLVVTGVSVAVAVGIGGFEALTLLRDRFGLPQWSALEEHFDLLGFAIIGFFAATWIFSRLRSQKTT
jgi:high-affinity nickel-transport protein